MKHINKKIAVLIGGVLISGAIRAQQGTIIAPNEHFPLKNWFITGAVGEQWMSKTYGNIFTAKISAGTWINKYSGVRIYAKCGSSPVSKTANSGYIGGGADYMLNLLALKDYDRQSRFSLNLIAGMGFDQFDLEKSGLKLNYTKVSTMSVNLGIQAGYQFNSHVGLFVEPSFQALPKYYDKANKNSFIFGANLSFGASYYFNRHSYAKKEKDMAPLEAEVQRMTEEMKRINDEINLLRKELQQEQQKREGKIVMTAPEKEQVAIDVFFDKFSSFMGNEQCQKIDAIGEWMKNNEFNIQIVAFSDNLVDNQMDQQLRTTRSKAIAEVLTKKYGIQLDRIDTVTSESMGYENLTGCNAKIIFIATE